VQFRCVIALCSCMFSLYAAALEPEVLRDVEYATVDGHKLLLDLYRPPVEEANDQTQIRSGRAIPCVVFVHGGGWKGGDKKSAKQNAAWLVDHGFAVVSINYRLTDIAQWPAQINDCYEAVRWVRRNSQKYGIDPDRIGVFGTSAGAHLGALMGTRSFPGHESVSSRVHAVCDWFGPSDLMTMPPNNIGNGRTAEDVAQSNGAKLLGATVRDVPRLAADASAIDHVSGDAAAFLIMHGDQDTAVPVSQSTLLHQRLVASGAVSELHVVKGGKHGGTLFRTDDVRQRVCDFFQRNLMKNWNQGTGPNARFRVLQASAPKRWSVVRDERIKWKITLPGTGQSTVVSWGDRIFFTTMKPVYQDSTIGSDIEAWCCDANTGKTLWKRSIAAKHPLRLSGCFSDSTAPPPVTDGRFVCFFNASGTIACFDFEGDLQWSREVMAVGRTQPTLIRGNVVFIKQSYMPDGGGKFTHEHGDAPLEKWTQLQAIDLHTGEDRWATTCGVNMGCVPLFVSRTDGREVMVVGRGGGHSPPEKPTGISMVDATDGKTLWTLPLPKFMSTMTYNLVGDDILVFDAGNHLWIDAFSGKVKRQASIVKDVSVRLRGDEAWKTQVTDITNVKKPRSIIQQSNVLAGVYHYFRSYTEPWLGRVDSRTGRVEYLQLPVQMRPASERQKDELLWGPKDMDAKVLDALVRARKKPATLPITKWAFKENDMKDANGNVVMGDQRSMGNGWGHHASQLPTVIGDCLYVPTMAGTVYVIQWDCETLDEDAIVAINDLGPVGESWNRASLSFANDSLFAHTIDGLICIGD
jgi:acetyl esterase/lipase